MLFSQTSARMTFTSKFHGASNLFDGGDNYQEKRFWRGGQAVLDLYGKIRDDNGIRQGCPAGKVKTSRELGCFCLWRFRCHFFQRFLAAGGCEGNNFAEIESQFG